MTRQQRLDESRPPAWSESKADAFVNSALAVAAELVGQRLLSQADKSLVSSHLTRVLVIYQQSRPIEMEHGPCCYR
jgi:hypothetical protein